jgi:hypothetical protein
MIYAPCGSNRNGRKEEDRFPYAGGIYRYYNFSVNLPTHGMDQPSNE